MIQFSSNYYTFKKIFLFIAINFLCNILKAQFPAQYAPSSTYAGTYNIDGNLVVGTVGGSGGASSGGSANYSVPIQVPSGLNGLAPSVRINYSSNNGNGIAGYGFNLSATSSITYEDKGMYYDATVSAADITKGSAFALDGNRLILTSGTYGQSGAVYGTAQETFAKITSTGSAGACTTCPQTFTVITRNGMTMEYGSTDPSEYSTVKGNGSTFPFMWLLNKMTDNYGNYLKYSYSNNTTTGEVLLMQIDYYTSTNNMYAQVIFGYSDNRSDKNTISEYGSEVSQIHQIEKKKLLTSIEVKSESLLVRKYELIYSFDGFYSFLQEIKLKGADGTTALNPTWFNYGETSPNPFQSTTNSTPYTSRDFFPVDVDGDGFDELFEANYTTNNSIGKIYSSYKIYKVNASTGLLTQLGATGTLITAETFNGTTCSIYTKFEFYDMNGDGREDVVLERIARYLNKNYLKEVKILTLTNTPTPNTLTLTNYAINTTVPLFRNSIPPRFNPEYGKSDFYVGDFDGDGRGDIIVNDTLKSYISFPFLVNELNKELYYDNGTGPLVNFITQYKIAPNNYSNIVNADNDRKSDLMIMQFYNELLYDTDAGHFYTFSKNGSNQYVGKKCIKDLVISSQNYQCFLNGDFNGDGLSDYFSNNGSATTINTKQGKLADNITFTFQEATSFTEINKDNNTTNKNEALLIDDFNGDGKDDILHFRKNPNANSIDYFYVYYFNGLAYTREVYQVSGIGSTAYFYPIQTGDFNGDGRADVLHRNKTTGAFRILYFKPKGKERLLTKVRDGLSNVTEFSYKLLTEDVNYTYTNVPNQFPINEVRPAAYVVDKVKVPDGVGGIGIETQYFYKQLTRQKAKAGTLGFLITAQKNLLTNTYSQQENIVYDQTSVGDNCLLLPSKSWTCVACSTANAAQFKTDITTPLFTVIENGANKSFKLQSKGSITTDALHGNTTTVSAPQYDAYNNITSQTTTVTDGTNPVISTVSTPSNTFVAITPSLIPTLPDGDITTTTTMNGNSFSKVINNNYDNKGKIIQTVSGSGTNSTTTINTYDPANGNLLTTSTSTPSANSPTRSQSFTYYDPLKRFLKEVKDKDVNGDVVVLYENYDARWEKPAKVTNGALTTLYNETTFDANFGFTLTTKPNYWAAPINYETKYTSSHPNAVYYSKITHPDEADITAYYDLYGRTLKTVSEGDKINTSTNTYNNKGELQNNVSTDVYGADITTNYSGYDIYSRVATVATVPNITTVGFSYPFGKNEVAVTTNGITKTTTTDALGNIVKVIDPYATLTYTYHGNGALKEVKNGTTIQSTEIDANGFQSKLIDLNAGTTIYDYNGFGDLIKQKDANNNETILEYDALGRLLRTELSNASPQGSQDAASIPVNTDYFYHLTGANKYLLDYVNNGSAKLTYGYDDKRRNNSVTTKYENIDYTQSYTLDNYGKVQDVTYPNNFKVNYGYGSSVDGTIQTITAGTAGGTTTNVFTTPTYNNAYQCLTYNLGYGAGLKGITNDYEINGLLKSTVAKTGMTDYFNYKYTWDIPNGNLTKREDKLPTRNLVEEFGYDTHKQTLTSIKLGTNLPNIIDYAANGNILNKYDAGFSTDPAKPAYSYGSPKPNAVTEIKQVNTSPSSPAPSAISKETQDIKYNGFNQPVIVKQMAYGTGTETTKTTYQYGIGTQRIKSIYAESGTPKCTTYYFGNYEKHIDNAGTRDVYYINTPDGLGAIAVNTGGTLKYYYAVKDHLGSIMTLTDETGAINTEQSFDAWGRVRKPADWTYGNFNQPIATSISKAGGNNTNGWFTRGYTGHEHLYKQDLINMNGRMYDPIAGRMLSPDNYVQDPTSLHSFNRYSYVINNPLRYTDPSGQKVKNLEEGRRIAIVGDEKGGGGGGSKNDGNFDGWAEPRPGQQQTQGGYSYTNGSPYSSNWGRSFNNVGNYSNITFNGNPLYGGVGGSGRSGGGLNRPFANNGESSPRDFLDMSGAVAQVGGGNYIGHRKPLYPHNNNYLRIHHSKELSEHVNDAMSSSEFSTLYRGYTLGELLNELPSNNKYHSFGEGPTDRFLVDPLYFNVVIDLKHFLNSIIKPSSFGDYNENIQEENNNPSAHNPQDYYSNNLGNEFYKFYRTKEPDVMLPHDINLIDYIIEFLNSLTARENK